MRTVGVEEAPCVEGVSTALGCNRPAPANAHLGADIDSASARMCRVLKALVRCAQSAAQS